MQHAGTTRAGRAAGIIAAIGATTIAQADCDWIATPGVDAGNGAVNAMAVYDAGNGPALFAAGTLHGSAGNELAQWVPGEEPGDGAWQRTPFQSGFTSVNAMAVYDGELYIGGTFAFAGGETANRIARWDDNTWNTVGGGVSGIRVEAMVVYDGALYVGGEFDNAGGVDQTSGIARWDGDEWSSVDGGLSSGEVRSLAVYDDGDGEGDGYGEALYVGGNFLNIGTSEADNIARWDGEGWSSVGDGGLGVNIDVTALTSFDGSLYAGGNFREDVDGESEMRGVARWDGDAWSYLGEGVLDDPHTGTIVYDIAGYHDQDGEPVIIAAGRFTEAGDGMPVNHIAQWDGDKWSALGDGLDGTAQVLMTYNDGHGESVFVGGTFTHADGVESDGAARWNCPISGAAPPDPSKSLVEAEPASITGYGGTATVTVTPHDAAGEKLGDGLDVQITANAGDWLDDVNDEGDGTYTRDLLAQGGADGQAVITAVVEGVTLAQSPTVNFVPVHPGKSSIEIASSFTLPGGQVDVTVVPRDGDGQIVGSGFAVDIHTTRGSLDGEVTDHGDGTYTQTLNLPDPGTATLTATVDGMLLDAAASVTVLDPDDFGEVAGIDQHGHPVGYHSIQDAVDAADVDGLLAVLVGPGEYEETVLVDGVTDLTIEAIAASEPAVIRGIVFSDSQAVTVQNLHIVNSPGDGIRMLGRNNASSSIELDHLRIDSAGGRGMRIDQDNHDIVLSNVEILNSQNDGIRMDRHVTDVLMTASVITGNIGNGVRIRRDSSGIQLIGNTLAGNGKNGLRLDRDVALLIEANDILNNGASSGGGNGYGINLQRSGRWGSPHLITVIQNTFDGNNGNPQPNRSDEHIRNYDQMFDDNDDQPGY